MHLDVFFLYGNLTFALQKDVRLIDLEGRRIERGAISIPVGLVNWPGPQQRTGFASEEGCRAWPDPAGVHGPMSCFLDLLESPDRHHQHTR